MRTVCLDTESFYDSEVTIKKLGGYHYCHHPKCDVYTLSVYDGQHAWAGHPRDFNFSSLDGVRLLSHNKAHDEEIALAQEDLGLWPKLNYAEWHCTANLTSFLCNRRSLAQASEFLLGEKMGKGMRDWMKGHTWEEAVAAGKGEELLEYARTDAVSPWRIWEKYAHKWPEWERRLSELTIQQGRRGVHIHQERLQAGIVALERVILTATDSLPWVKAGMKPGSPRGVAQACRDSNIPSPPVKARYADAAAEWEEKYASSQPWVKALKDLRKAKKMVATLKTMRQRLRPDGTLPFSLKYFGAHTGRFSGDAGINFQNFNAEPLFITADWQLVGDRQHLDELMEQFRRTPDVTPLLLVDVRGLILPPPGMEVASVDLSQIEPRVLNKLAGNEALLQQIRDGFPIYEAHARGSMGWTGGVLKVENPKKYKLAKARILGLGFSCGWEKFITVARIMAGLDITEEDESEALKSSCDGQIHLNDEGVPYVILSAVHINSMGNEEIYKNNVPVYGFVSKGIVQDFRENNPLITGFWGQMQDALESASQQPKGRNDLQVELPSGRMITYRDVRREWRIKIDKETGKSYRRTVFTAEADGRRKIFYGGLIVENITQAVARDVFCQNMLKILDAGIWPMWSVHDEAVTAVHNKEEGELARKLMASDVTWAGWTDLPVEAELALSDRFGK